MDKFAGRKWIEVKREISQNYHMLTLLDPKAPEIIDVAKAFESHGTECGMACLAAYLHIDKWGCERTAQRAVDMYAEIMREGDHWPGSQEFQDMLYWSSWMSTGPVDHLEWPLAPTRWPKDLDKRAGICNVMLRLTGPSLRYGNCQVLAGTAIMKFLVEGMKKSRAKRV